MFKLSDCSTFKVSVFEENSDVFVIVLGIGIDSVNGFSSLFKVERKKKFSSKKACMDFYNECVDSDYIFVEEDFLFASNRFIPMDYFRCGVDFDEE